MVVTGSACLGPVRPLTQSLLNQNGGMPWSSLPGIPQAPAYLLSAQWASAYVQPAQDPGDPLAALPVQMGSV